MITETKVKCPICSGEHVTLRRTTGIAMVACAKLTPVGETRTFPLADVIVVGAGAYVDTLPSTEPLATEREPTLAELRAEKARRDEESERLALLRELGEGKPAAPATAPAPPSDPTKKVQS